MASLPIASLLHATNAKKDNYAMSRAGYWKSLLQPVNIRSVGVHA